MMLMLADIYIKEFIMTNVFTTLQYIEIETISSCTRKCHWCLFGQYPDYRPKETQILETECIEELFYDLKNNGFSGVIGLFSINEPLLDSRITSGYLIEKCRNILGNSVRINLTTNGDLLSDTILESLFVYGLDQLKISCYSQESYYRMLQLTNGYTQVRVLDQIRYNRGEFESNRGGAVLGSNRKPREFFSCAYPYYRTAIGWNGNVRICYNNILEDIVLGNIHDKLFSEIVNSSDSERLRQAIYNQRQTIFPCNRCNVQGSGLKESNIKALGSMSMCIEGNI